MRAAIKTHIRTYQRPCTNMNRTGIQERGGAVDECAGRDMRVYAVVEEYRRDDQGVCGRELGRVFLLIW